MRAELRRGRAGQACLGVRQEPRRICLRQDLQRRVAPGRQAQHVLGAARELDPPGHPLPRPAPLCAGASCKSVCACCRDGELAATSGTQGAPAHREPSVRAPPRWRAAARTSVPWPSSSRGESSTLPEFDMWPPAQAAPRAAGRPAASACSSASRELRVRTRAVSAAKRRQPAPTAPSSRAGLKHCAGCARDSVLSRIGVLRQLRAQAALSHGQEVGGSGRRAQAAQKGPVPRGRALCQETAAHAGAAE